MDAIKTRHGPMFGLSTDSYITRSLMLYGEYCPAEWSALSQIVKPGMTVVEAGANIGTHSVPLAKSCYPGQIYLFEPQQRLFQILCANLALNDVTNAIAIPEACGAADGFVTIPLIDYSSEGNFGSVSVYPYSGIGPRIRVMAIDALRLPSCGLLKIDVEGYEANVLDGATDTIKRCRPTIYVENDRVQNRVDLIERIRNLKYRMYWHRPALFREDNFNNYPEDVFGNVVSTNMLCIPEEKGTIVKGFGEVS